MAERASAMLTDAEYDVQLLATSGPGEAEPLANSVRDEIDLLVVAGGDGTIREAISGLGDESRRVQVGVLPCGNANVVARELQIPLTEDAALDVLREGRARQIDVGRIGSELFLAMVGIGWDARTVQHLSRLRASRLGGWWYRVWADSAYFLAGLAALWKWRSDRLTIRAAGETLARPYCATVVANFRCYGKGWTMVPDADASSGFLHYQARKRFGALFVAWQLIAAMLARRVPRFISDHGRATRITVRAERAFAVQVDGDFRAATTEVEISVEPGAAWLIGPEL
jgi:diacylglycerol kinase family enzyme